MTNRSTLDHLAADRAAARKSFETDKLTANVYRNLRADAASKRNELLRSNGLPVKNFRGADFHALPLAMRVTIDVLDQEVHRLVALVNEYEISAGQTAAQHPSVVA